MEEDPVFKKMRQRSHILRKAQDLEIPMVPLRVNAMHQFIATTIIATATHFSTFFLDTIKVRVQAHNKLEDVSHYVKNNVEKQTKSAGILKGYGLVLISSAVHVTVTKMYGLVAGCLFQGLIKTFLEMSKINTQMGKAAEGKLMMAFWPKVLPFIILRDLTYRSIFATGAGWSAREQQVRRNFNKMEHLGDLVAISSVATLLSHPFDVVVTKIASQKYIKYDSIVNGIKTIVSQEGASKLWGSGLQFRLISSIVAMYVAASTYPSLIQMVAEAY